jgi:hypothetical protein
MKNAFSILLLAFGVLSAGTIFFTPKKILELKQFPREQAETMLMLKPSMLLQVKSCVTDSAGKEWYMVDLPKEKLEGFVPSGEIEILGDEAQSSIYLKLTTEESQDKKRRLIELRKHAEWPMRVRSAVHNGAICLKMSVDQLYASWQKPYVETSGFILGFGNVDIFFYRQDNPVAVVVKNNEVIGWSEKGK